VSATIFWRIVKPQNDKHLHTPAPSAFMEALRDAEMELPHTFDSGDVKVLRGMAAVCRGDTKNNPFRELADLIEQHDAEIHVWPEY
jgi:hypothetical protein